MFIHIIANCNHAVSLAKCLRQIDAHEEHIIFIKDVRYHSQDYMSEVVKNFPSTRLLSGNLNITKSECVIIHGIFSNEDFNILSALLNMEIKVVWNVWGGDSRLMGNAELLPTLNRISYLFCAPGELLRYPDMIVPVINCNLYNAGLDDKSAFVSMKEKLIVLGNSADPSNNHEYLLSLIGKFTSYRFVIPFSYNATNDYMLRIQGLLREYSLEDRVDIITRMLSFSDYADLLRKAKAVFFAHNRQQGLGTARLAYELGCQVFMKKIIKQAIDIPTQVNPGYIDLVQMGYVDIHEITIIEHMTEDEFSIFTANRINALPELANNSPREVSRIFSVLKRELWR